MSNNNLFRLGGIAAILSAVFYIFTLGIGFAGITGILATVLYVISSLLFLVVAVVLYMDLRTESVFLALVALILLGVMTVWSMFIDPTTVNPVFGPLTLAYGIGFVLEGWLQRRSSHYPNGIGILCVVTGLVAVIAGIGLIAGAGADVFGLINLIFTVPWVIWLVWLGRHYLKSKAWGLQAA